MSDLKSAAEAAAVRPLLEQIALVQVRIAHEIPGTAAQPRNAQDLEAALQRLQQVAPELILRGDFGLPVGVDHTHEPALLAIRPPANAPETAAADVSAIMSALTNVSLKTAVGPNVAGRTVFTVAASLDSSINALKAIGVPGLASELQRFEDGLPPG